MPLNAGSVLFELAARRPGSCSQHNSIRRLRFSNAQAAIVQSVLKCRIVSMDSVDLPQIRERTRSRAFALPPHCNSSSITPGCFPTDSMVVSL